MITTTTIVEQQEKPLETLFLFVGETFVSKGKQTNKQINKWAKKKLRNWSSFCMTRQVIILLYTSSLLDGTHLDAVRGFIYLRGLKQRINKRSSSKQCYFVKSEETDLLKYFAKDWIQY